MRTTSRPSSAFVCADAAGSSAEMEFKGTPGPREPGTLTRLRRLSTPKRRCVDHLEVRALHLAERVEVVVVPALVRRARDVPGRSVVRQDHPVALEGDEDGTGLLREAVHVETCLEAQALAHRRKIRVGQARREVPRGVDERLARAVRREAQRVVDAALLQVLVAREPRQDRQAGGVCRGPSLWPDLVRLQTPGRAGTGLPRLAAVLRIGGVELVELAGVAVDHDHVAITLRLAA